MLYFSYSVWSVLLFARWEKGQGMNSGINSFLLSDFHYSQIAISSLLLIIQRKWPVTNGHVIKETATDWPRYRGRKSTVPSEKMPPQTANFTPAVRNFQFLFWLFARFNSTCMGDNRFVSTLLSELFIFKTDYYN